MTTSARVEERPFYLTGNFAPVAQELTVDDLPVDGAVPPQLRGLYLRNGPNPKGADEGHWFVGDGMLHGVRLEGGKAKWYRNRCAPGEGVFVRRRRARRRGRRLRADLRL